MPTEPITQATTTDRNARILAILESAKQMVQRCIDEFNSGEPKEQEFCKYCGFIVHTGMHFPHGTHKDGPHVACDDPAPGFEKLVDPKDWVRYQFKYTVARHAQPQGEK